MKVDKVVEEAKQALNDGHCVVVGLQNTGEANTENRIQRDGYIDGFISSCREILLNFINNHFPVEIEFQVPVPVKSYDSWSLKARELLIQYASQLQLSDRYGVV